jgi:hypothetical protein
VNLAIGSDDATWPDERTRVKEPRTVPLQESENGVDVEPAAHFRQCICTWSRDGFGVEAGFVGAVEAIAGQRAFRKDDEPRCVRLRSAFPSATSIWTAATLIRSCIAAISGRRERPVPVVLYSQSRSRDVGSCSRAISSVWTL